MVVNFNRILIADDDAVIREMVTYLIGDLFNDYTITLAKDGADALQKFEQAVLSNYQFSLIITDFEMPNMDGIQFARKVRKASSECKIILFSGTDNENLPNTDGIDAIVHKTKAPPDALENEILSLFAHMS